MYKLVYRKIEQQTQLKQKFTYFLGICCNLIIHDIDPRWKKGQYNLYPRQCLND